MWVYISTMCEYWLLHSLPCLVFFLLFFFYLLFKCSCLHSPPPLSPVPPIHTFHPQPHPPLALSLGPYTWVDNDISWFWSIFLRWLTFWLLICSFFEMAVQILPHFFLLHIYIFLLVFMTDLSQKPKRQWFFKSYMCILIRISCLHIFHKYIEIQVCGLTTFS